METLKDKLKEDRRFAARAIGFAIGFTLMMWVLAPDHVATNTKYSLIMLIPVAGLLGMILWINRDLKKLDKVKE